MRDRVSVEDILAKALIAEGYEGLCNDDCGCGLDNLAPCEHMWLDCVAAYAWVCAADPACRAECSEYEEGYTKGCFRSVKQAARGPHDAAG